MTIKKKIFTTGIITFLIFVILALMNVWTHLQVLSNLKTRDQVNERLADIETFAKWKNDLIRSVSDIVASGHVPRFADQPPDTPSEFPIKEGRMLLQSGKRLISLIREKELATQETEKRFRDLRQSINDLYYRLDDKISTVLAVIQIDQVLGKDTSEKSSLPPYVLKSLNQLTLVALNSLISRNYSDEDQGVVAKNGRFLSSQLRAIDTDGSIAALFDELFAQIRQLRVLIPNTEEVLRGLEAQIAEERLRFDNAAKDADLEHIVAEVEAEVRQANARLEQASQRNLITVTVFLFVVPIFLIGIGLLGLNSLIIGPITHLAAAMKHVEDGSFDETAPVRSQDEIGVLARAFSTMAGDIRAKVTEMEQLNRTLKESECKYRTLVDNLPQRIFHKNRDLAYVSCNRNFARDLGLTEAEVVGKTDFDFFSEPLAKKYREDDARILRTEHTEEIEETYVRNGKDQIVLTVKTPIRNEQGEVSGVLGIFWDISERKRAEEALHLARFSLENASVAIFWIGSEGQLRYGNESACRTLGYDRDELLGMRIWAVDTAFSPETYEQYWQDMHHGEPVQSESAYRRRDDTVFPVEISARQAEFRGVRLIFAFVTDITERKKMETQLVQAQKMESVGRLAGGVAHDFNNMLSIILGNTEMILEDIGNQGNPLTARLLGIQKAAQRSANLTRQLLAFARKQTIAPRVLDINEILEAMLKMLRQLIGEDIDLVWLPAEKLWAVRMDPSQMDQILVNLCINARDAIRSVGNVTIETGNVSFDEEYCRSHAGFHPGDYVMIAISDNGCGMDRETLANLFEPFFTTKDVGQGTGLGLATVYGIIRQNRGFINVYSEPGRGTTFRIYLPRHADDAAEEAQKTSENVFATGHETILLVEDEASVLDTTKAMLERLGYRILAASRPDEAIRMSQSCPREIHMLITDVVMPGMSGRDLARNLCGRYPNLRCLFMSGYTANVIAHHGVLDEGVQFIHKPFSRKDLAAKVREVLGEADVSG